MKLGLNEKIHFAKRHAMRQVDNKPTDLGSDDPALTAKSADDIKLISDSLAKNHNLNELIHLDEQHIADLAACARKKTFQPGQVVIEQGSLDAEEFYVIKVGGFRIWYSPDS